MNFLQMWGKIFHIRFPKKIFQHLPPMIADDVYFSPIIPNEIEEEVNKLKVKKGRGPYNIPISILKTTSHLISKPLSVIYNIFSVKWNSSREL